MMSDNNYQPLLRICSYDHGGYVAWGWWKGWDGPGGLKDYIRRSISRLDQFPKLKWGFHMEGATWDWVLANDPAFADEFKEWVDNTHAGRISLSSGGYGQPLSCTICDESNVRQLTYDREAYDKLGYRINIYMQNEHGFFPQLPQLLKQAGIDRAIMRTVWGMYGINPEINASKVRWRSPEGTWVETIPTYVGGNRGLGKNTWDTRIFIGLEGYIDFEPFRKHYLEQGVRYPIAIRIDDYPLPRDDDGSGGFNRLCSYSDMPGYRWVTGEEAFEEIPFEDVDLDTCIDDYPIQMPWGFQGNIFWNLSRQAENSILTAERLAAVNTLFKGAHWEELIDRAWKKLLAAQHHDINICGVSSGGEYGELMLDVAKSFYGESISLSNTVTQAALRAVLSNFDSQPSDRAIAVYNPLNWSREAVVPVCVKSDRKRLPEGFRVTLDGCPADFQVIDKKVTPGDYVSWTTLAVRVPLQPMGFTLLNLDFIYEKQEPVNTMDISETDREIAVSTNWGKVAVNRKTGELLAFDKYIKPLLMPGAGNGTYTAVVDDQQCTTVPANITVESAGPLFTVVRTTGMIGTLSFISDATIYRDEQRIDFKTTIVVHGETVGETCVPSEWEGKDEPVIQEKKLMVNFTPTLDEQVKVAQDFPFSVGETCNKHINAGYWVDISDGRQGMTFLNRGTMGYMRNGSTLSNILLYSGKYSWGQVQAYLEGSYTLEYGISFHSGDWRDGKAHKTGLEYNLAPVAFCEPSRGGKRSPEEAGLTLVDAATGQPCNNLIVSALYTRNYQMYVRLYEYLGISETSFRITLADRPAGLAPVNLLHEEAGEALDSVVIPAYGIRTFRLMTG